MIGGRVFVDTVFVQALLSSRDPYHELALAMMPRFESVEKWVTEAILIEVCDALSRSARRIAKGFVHRCYADKTFRIVAVDADLIASALALYDSRIDKSWGLTDCISFVVMSRNGLSAALTADHHFVQAGFRALMLEDA